MTTFYPEDLTTLTAVRADKSIGATYTGDDELLRRYIRAASNMWGMWTGRQFVPYIDTKKFSLAHVEGLSLCMNEDLLSVTSVTNADGASVSGSDYAIRPDNIYPKNTLEMLDSGANYWRFLYVSDRVQVVGLWGYHENYDIAWGDSLDTVENNPLTSSGTSLTVNDADGTDDRYLPRFEVGDYLKIESEFLQVTTINTATNVLGVLRGVRGTTAASHAQNVAIYVYRQHDAVRWAVTEIVKWMYEHRDSVNRGVQLSAELGVIIQNDLPEVKAMADKYLRKSAVRILAV